MLPCPQNSLEHFSCIRGYIILSVAWQWVFQFGLPHNMSQYLDCSENLGSSTLSSRILGETRWILALREMVWRVLSPGMQHCVVRRKSTDVTKNCIASIFRVRSFIWLHRCKRFTLQLAGAHNSVVRWGTVLQAGRLPVRIPMSLNYLQFTSSFQPHYGPGVGWTFYRNEYQGSSLG
jgi:hypothetical protein